MPNLVHRWDIHQYCFLTAVSHNPRDTVKKVGKDARGFTIVHPPVALDVHVAVQGRIGENLVCSGSTEVHMPDFHHYDDASAGYLGGS
ncbi:hypothetical protein Tco_1428649 [Tanacetum coccineum]